MALTSRNEKTVYLLRRRYEEPAEALRGVVSALRSVPILVGTMWSGSLPTDFRERLMLTVTAVNACRYCAYAHTRLARRAGVHTEEADQLIAGVVDAAPPAQRPALAYARAWASAGGTAPADVTKDLTTIYGRRTARAITAALNVIQAGNLLGNTLDHYLEAVSCR
jgi:AhpD family alkylhydroperoxidase